MKFKFYFLAPSVLSIGFLFSLISIGSDKWISSELILSNYSETFYFHEGLWRLCVWKESSSDSSEYHWQCTYIGVGKYDTLDAVRGLSMISICLFVLVCILSLIAYIKDSALFSILSAISALVEALCFAVGLAIYAAKINQDHLDGHGLDWSFWTGWASVAILFLSVGLFSFQAFYLNVFRRRNYTPIDSINDI